MTSQQASAGRPLGSRNRDSIPILTVRLGPARDFLIALAVLTVTILVAMLVAFVAYG
jgi:hypothetical protein